MRAIGTVWLAQTTGCAQCHDHKFDPITTRDFYRLGAFFADIKETAIGRREDGMIVATPEQETKLKEFEARIATLQQQTRHTTPELAAAQAAWEESLAEGPQDVAWTALHAEKADGEKGSQLTVREDETIKVEAVGNPPADTFRYSEGALRGITGFKLEVMPSDSLPREGRVARRTEISC